MSAATLPLIGFLGIGAMGLPMANNIHTGGHRIKAVDLNPGQVSKALDQGLAASTSIDDLDDADALFVVVATGAQLLSLLETRPLSGSGAVKTVAVLSTVGVQDVKTFADTLNNRGITVIDCPVTGGVSGAIDATLKLFAAGDHQALQTLRAALETMGSIQDCGDTAGDGQAYKMVNQLLAASHLAVAGEALAFARALGLDPAKALEAVIDGAGGSWMLKDRGPRMVLAPQQRPTQTHLSIFIKDTNLVLAAAKHADFDARILTTVAHEFKQAAEAGLETADDSSIIDINRNPPTNPPSA